MKVISHPNGFLRVTFSHEADGTQDRLHVWDVSGYEDGDIHQHGSDFTSTIIEGVMREELYAAVDDKDGDYERWTADCWVDREGNYHVDESAPRVRCRALLEEVLIHNPGDTYERTASFLHKVIAVKVPLITRSSVGPKYLQGHSMLRKRHEENGAVGAPTQSSERAVTAQREGALIKAIRSLVPRLHACVGHE